MNPKGLIQTPDNDWLISKKIKRGDYSFIQKIVRREKDCLKKSKKKA